MSQKGHITPYYMIHGANPQYVPKWGGNSWCENCIVQMDVSEVESLMREYAAQQTAQLRQETQTEKAASEVAEKGMQELWDRNAELSQELEQMKAQRDEAVKLLKEVDDPKYSAFVMDWHDRRLAFLSSITK